MHYQSLNESIMSVTNPQPKLTQDEYIEILESALDCIAEELDCDMEDLLEDLFEMAQSPQRKRQVISQIDRAQERQSRSFNPSQHRWTGNYDSSSTKSVANRNKLSRYRKAEKDEQSKRNLFNKEVGSKKVYGLGGRVLKRKLRSTDTTSNRNL